MSPPASPAIARLADLAGAENVIAEPAALAAYRVDGIAPQAALRPGSAEEVADILRFAGAERLSVIPSGGRSKLGIGMPPRAYDLALDVSRMNRVAAYDPGDLTLGVEPGVRFAELAARLAAEKQFLPMTPAFAERATLGGIVAANCDSALRQGYGSIRDYILGMEFVTGAGVAAKSGGRVVKNVTGYDLHKLLLGSLGTLAVITRINFRTFPVAPEQRTFLAAFANSGAALGWCARLAQSQLQLRMLEVLDPAATRIVSEAIRTTGGPDLPDGRWWVAAGAAGQRAAVERHARELDRMARDAQAEEFVAVDAARGEALVGALGEFPAVVQSASPQAAIFRIGALPSAMPSLVERIGAAAKGEGLRAAILARPAGVLYAAIVPRTGDDAGGIDRLVSACRKAMEACAAAGTHPMIEWCPTELKRQMNVWPPAGDAQALAERIKKVFDPQGILAPGRFQGGL